jgi:hypothetical protein
MSLLIGLLASPTSPELQDATKLGVLLGSGLSALMGEWPASFHFCRYRFITMVSMPMAMNTRIIAG